MKSKAFDDMFLTTNSSKQKSTKDYHFNKFSSNLSSIFLLPLWRSQILMNVSPRRWNFVKICKVEFAWGKSEQTMCKFNLHRYFLFFEIHSLLFLVNVISYTFFFPKIKLTCVPASDTGRRFAVWKSSCAGKTVWKLRKDMQARELTEARNKKKCIHIREALQLQCAITLVLHL